MRGGGTVVRQRLPQTPAAIERDADRLARRASYPTLLAVVTGWLAVAQLVTLPLAVLQSWWAGRALVLLRRGRAGEAQRPLGLAVVIGVSLIGDSIVSPLVALDLLNLGALWLAWWGTDRARARRRVAWGVAEVETLDRAAARSHRSSPLEVAERARRDAEDDLAYLDELGDGPDGATS